MTDSGSNGLGNLSLKLLRNYLPGCQAAVPGVEAVEKL
jgi:hypothetical protein